jgi:FtsH-binding integral membrane protein
MNLLSKWKEKIAHYIEVRVQLMKLSFIERTSNVLSYLVFTFISLFLLLAVLIFIGIGIGEFFGEVLDSKAGGFFITAGIYLLFCGILFLMRQNIVNTFSGIFIKILTDNDDDDDDDNRDEKSSGNPAKPNKAE